MSQQMKTNARGGDMDSVWTKVTGRQLCIEVQAGQKVWRAESRAASAVWRCPPRQNCRIWQWPECHSWAGQPPKKRVGTVRPGASPFWLDKAVYVNQGCYTETAGFTLV